jgi:hypothetical protein
MATPVAVTNDVDAFVNVDNTTWLFNPPEPLQKDGVTVVVKTRGGLAAWAGNTVSEEAVWKPHKELWLVKDTWPDLKNHARDKIGIARRGIK